MHQRVMLRAQQHQVLEARLAAVRPVFDVVAVKVAAVLAAREPAATIVPGP